MASVPTPAPNRKYHVAHFKTAHEANAFVAKLQHVLSSPPSAAQWAVPHNVEIWAPSPMTEDVYLSEGALQAAKAASLPVPVVKTVRGKALPAGSARIVGET